LSYRLIDSRRIGCRWRDQQRKLSWPCTQIEKTVGMGPAEAFSEKCD
jgi:hypothetical protein